MNPMSHPTPLRDPARRGFALILSLGLMALMVLLTLTLSAMIGVESEGARQTQMQAIARQNAQMAVYQALGFLQIQAGPDNKVTARAEILSASVAHPMWTGVWSGTNSATTPVWLVSGARNSSGALSTGNPSVAYSGTTETVSIMRVISTSTDYKNLHANHSGEVIVERMKLSTGEQHTGGYAWWIADEGVKASAALVSDTLTDTISAGNNLTEADIRRARQYGPLRAGLEDAALSQVTHTLSSLEDLGTEKLRWIARVGGPRELSYVDKNLFPERDKVGDSSFNSSWFSHDLTGMSYGVLADTGVNTGLISLKTDLSTALLNTWTWNVKSQNNASISRLENTAVRMPSARSDWDAWAPGLSAYLNIWKVATVQAGTNSAGAQVYQFPLTAPVAYPAVTPGGRPDPQTGTPVFSVAPVLSEFLFTFGAYAYDQAGNIAAKWPSSSKGSAFTKGKCPKIKGFASNGTPIYSTEPCKRANGVSSADPDSAMFCQTKEHLHTSSALGFDRVPWALRLFSASEYWNPYTSDILFPTTGKLQLRINGFPKLRFTFYKANTLNDAKWSTKGWSAVNINNPDANMQELLEAGNPDVSGWGTIDLNRPAVALVPTNSFRVFAGETTPWGGMVPKNNAVIDTNRRLLSVYGIKDEVSYEMDSGNARQSYGTPNFQFFALTAAVSFSGLLCPVIERDNSQPVGSIAGVSKYSQVSWTSLNMRINIKSVETPAFQFELWYIPTDASGTALSSTAIFLSAYKATGSELNEGPTDNWSSENSRLATAYLIGRAGWSFVRRDSSDYQNKGSGRLSPHWLFSDQVVSPADLRQDKNDYGFVESVEPSRSALTSDNVNPWRDADISRLLSKKNGRFPLNTNLTDARALSNTESVSSSYKNNFQLPERDLASSAPIFELPTQRPVSLGNLQHVSLAGRRPFAIGNSWGHTLAQSGGDANAVFDKFYLSGLAPTASNSTDISTLLSDIDLTKPLLNAALVPLWTVGTVPTFGDSTDILAHFLVKGAFNINSTSVTAWKAMLSGLWLNEWEYADLKGTVNYDGQRQSAGMTPREIITSEDTEGLERTFFRYPYTAGQTYTAPAFSAARYEDDNLNRVANYVHKGEYVQPNQYRRGMRKLTEAQVSKMAESVVEQLRARKKPFTTMAEFLAPSTGTLSVLEKAISDANINDSVSDDTVSGTPELGSSVYLTQADLLNTLAPVLQARSDTFKIRAYGDVKNASNQIEAKAICEAIVQRYPDVVDSGATVQTPGKIGRQFRIVSIKWINE